jgi:hypothetical protein
MELHPMLIQFGGSLLAILLLAGLAALLKLGGKTALEDSAHLARIAGEIEDGFAVARGSISRGGEAALARDTDGRIMVIKSHGNKFSGRILDGSARVWEEVDALIVDPGEARFGTVRLVLADSSYWADAINRL